MRVVVTLLGLFGIQAVAHAYIGPGLGAGTIAVVLGFIGSIFLALLAVFYYPIKRMLKKRTKSSENERNKDPGDERNKDKEDLGQN